MKKLISLVTLGLFLVAAPAAAQTFGFGAHAGVSVPLGDYADTDPNQGGFAESGFSGGLDLWYPLIVVPGLNWYTSVDAIAHSTDETTSGLAADAGYLYFPVMTGLWFDVPLGPMGLYATGQVGAIFARPPAADFGAGEVDGDVGTEFGLSLGIGVKATDNIYGGVKFYPMGDVEWSWDDGAATSTRPVSFFDVYVGFGVR